MTTLKLDIPSHYYDLTGAVLGEAELDAAEAQAGVAINELWRQEPKSFPSSVKMKRVVTVSWKPLGLAVTAPSGTTCWLSRHVDAPFVPRWLVVSTPGFTIEQLSFRHYCVLEDVDADLYLWSNWDKLKDAGQLERVRLTYPESPLTVGDSIRMRVTARPQLLDVMGGKALRQFRAMLIGEQLSTRPI